MAARGRHHWKPPPPEAERAIPAYQRKYDDDGLLLDKLIGLNSTGRPAPTAADRYPSEWRDLHKTSEQLEYEAKIARRRTKVHETPYGKEWDRMHRPDTGYWKAKTPLYDDVCRTTNTIPDVSPPKFNTKLPQKRAAMREVLARELFRTISSVGRKTVNVLAESRYAAGRLSTVGAGRDTVKREARESMARAKTPKKAAAGAPPKKRHRMLQNPEFPERRKLKTPPTAAAPRTKYTFFRLPGNGARKISVAGDSLESQLRHTPGVRSTVARRLFGQKEKRAAPVRPGARYDDRGLDELAYNTAPKARAPVTGGKVTMFMNSAPVVIGNNGNISKRDLFSIDMSIVAD